MRRWPRPPACLIGPMQSVQVEMGYLMLMKAFAAAVVGGFGSLPGAILGGIMVGIFENLGAAYISPSHKDIYAFLLLILVLMFRPSGLSRNRSKGKGIANGKNFALTLLKKAKCNNC